MARLSLKAYPNFVHFDAIVSGELKPAVLHVKLCVMTIEPSEIRQKVQEEFSGISGKDHAPTLQIQSLFSGSLTAF